MRRTIQYIVSVFVLIFLPIASSTADDAADVYREPSRTLVDIVDAPRTPWIKIGPYREKLLLRERPGPPPISELAERELGLAGLRIKPDINVPSRAYFYNGLGLMDMTGGEETPVAGMPENARISAIQWSPGGNYIAFINASDGGAELWVLDVDKGEARKLTGPVLNYCSGTDPAWFGDNTMICLLVPEDRGAEPEHSRVPGGPVVRQNLGKTAPARTYQYLLKNAHDEALFDYYFNSVIARVDLDGNIEKLGKPGLIIDFETSPDGRYILVETLHRPYSYLVPYYRFPRRIEVLNEKGETVRLVTDLPLQEEVPIAYGSVPTGPRQVSWRNDKGAVLYWVEALDGGDASRSAEVRDEVLMLEAPFDGEPVTLMKTKLRYGGVQWCRDNLAMIGEWWWRTRRTRSWRVRPGEPEREAELLFDRSWEDRYSDPGEPVTRRNEMGRKIIMTYGNTDSVFMSGDGASPEGNRPFLELLDVNTGETKRLFRSRAPYYEEPIIVFDDKGKRIFTRRESVEEPPNYFIRNLKKNKLTQVTDFPHPTPQLKNFSKELIRYEREDGVRLSATLYLPEGYNEENGPLPMYVTAYPREFKSADTAGQLDDSPYRFDRIGWWSPLLWLTQGYAVLDGPTMPIVGEGDREPNDTFVEQLVMSAEAAVEETVRRKVADPDRIAVGGHSYGAFMVANLLARSDLFTAGIAKTGAYNRTLTPFGFQSEQRTLWEAPEVYFEMSPFMHADKINEPILLIHGKADDNPGTFPMQSERFYNALKGLGGTARLVMLPYESHGYRARESILHMLWETERWLKTYIKEKPAPEDGKH